MERTAAHLGLDDHSDGTGIVGTPKISDQGLEFTMATCATTIPGEPIQPDAPTESGRVPRSAIHRASDELHETLQRLFDIAQSKIGQLDPSRDAG